MRTKGLIALLMAMNAFAPGVIADDSNDGAVHFGNLTLKTSNVGIPKNLSTSTTKKTTSKSDTGAVGNAPAQQTALAKKQLDQFQKENPQYGSNIPDRKGSPDASTKTGTGSMPLGAKAADAAGGAGGMPKDPGMKEGVMKGVSSGLTSSTKITKEAPRNVGAPVGFIVNGQPVSAAQVAALPPGTKVSVTSPTGQILPGTLKSRQDGMDLYNKAAYVSNASVSALAGVGGSEKGLGTIISWEGDQMYKLSRFGVTKGTPFGVGYYKSDQAGRDAIAQGGPNAGMPQMGFVVTYPPPPAGSPFDAFVDSGGGKGGGGKDAKAPTPNGK